VQYGNLDKGNNEVLALSTMGDDHVVAVFKVPIFANSIAWNDDILAVEASLKASEGD
jgi:hypothetical protein